MMSARPPASMYAGTRPSLTAVSIAAIGYARHYDAHGGARLAAQYNLFVAAMLAVLLADGPFGFLIAWEVMSLVGS